MKNEINNGFLNRSKAMDLFLKITEFGMSKFLAATTAVLAYSWIQSITAHPIGQFAGIGIIFLLVDFGITELLYFYFMEKSQDEAKTKARRAFLNLIVSVVAFKMIATATSSFWAAPDLAEYITGEDKTEYFAGQIENTQSANNTRMTTAQNVWNKLENSESKRVKDAEKKGDALVNAAIKSGTIHQVDMYKLNPGFFYALSRSSQYYRTNSNYIGRIDAAKREAKRLIDAEKEETKTALAVFQGTESDTTTTAALSMFINAASIDQSRHSAKLSRRTNFLWMLDFFSAFGLILVVRTRSLRLEAADHKGRQKTIVSALAAISERNYTALVNWLETFSGIDLDGNGTIGADKKDTTPPHVVPTKNNDFETVRAIQQLRSDTEKLKRFQDETVSKYTPETVSVETVKPENETLETVSNETKTETVNRPITVSVSSDETFHETVRSAVKQAVREERPETVRETVETVRETVSGEMKRNNETVKPETIIIRETVSKPTPPVRQKAETVSKAETIHTCLECNRSMKGKRSNAVFCSPKCKQDHHNKKR